MPSARFSLHTNVTPFLPLMLALLLPIRVVAKPAAIHDHLFRDGKPAVGYHVSLYHFDTPTLVKAPVKTEAGGIFTFFAVGTGVYCLKTDFEGSHWMNKTTIADSPNDGRIDLGSENSCGFTFEQSGTQLGIRPSSTQTPSEPKTPEPVRSSANPEEPSSSQTTRELKTPEPVKPPVNPKEQKPASQLGTWPWNNKDLFLTAVLCVFTFLLVLYPIGRYLFKPWAFRRDRLFGLLEGTAIVFYYKQFRPGTKIGDLKTGDDSLSTEAYMASFCSDFDHWYGRKYYIAPVCGLGALSLACAWWMILMMREWTGGSGNADSGHGLVAAALAGAFVWIISDEIDRLRRRDFTSSDVYYYIFRILLAVPFGWALTRLQYTSQVGIPVAFFLGAFPTTTLFTAARRIGGQQLHLGDDPSGALELEKLQSIGKDNAERFKDEGISTIAQLAYADPVDLTIRTNFDFNYVIDCVSQALMWIYIIPTTDLNLLSLRGAQEAAALVEWLKDSDHRTAAEATLTALAAKLNISEQALKTTLQQIASDPYTKFLVNAWT